jgi:hypothetical protein
MSYDGPRIGIRTCLLPVLQADSQSGGAAPTLSTVGFPDSTVRESRARRARGHPQHRFRVPIERITVNLAPADEGRPLPLGRKPDVSARARRGNHAMGA